MCQALSHSQHQEGAPCSWGWGWGGGEDPSPPSPVPLCDCLLPIRVFSEKAPNSKHTGPRKHSPPLAPRQLPVSVSGWTCFQEHGADCPPKPPPQGLSTVQLSSLAIQATVSLQMTPSPSRQEVPAAMSPALPAQGHPSSMRLRTQRAPQARPGRGGGAGGEMGVGPRQVRLHSTLTLSAPRTKGPQPSGFLPGAPTSQHSQQLPSGRGQLPWEQRAGLLGTRVNRRLNGCLCLPSPTENLAEKCQVQGRLESGSGGFRQTLLPPTAQGCGGHTICSSLVFCNARAQCLLGDFQDPSLAFQGPVGELA